MSEDEWVRVAMDDDKLVVDMLLKLHQPPPVGPPLLPSPPPKPAALSLNWSVRQPRSSSHNNNNNNNNKELSAKKKRAAAKEPVRASPSTPLSWSGGSSATDGAEESSGLHVVRSKVVLANKTPSNKRSRKKKTLAELREEEGLLLEEKRNLTSQLEAMRLLVEKERAKSEGLKKIKLDLTPRQTSKDVTSAVTSEQIQLEQSHKTPGECHPPCSISPICDGSNKLEQPVIHTSSNNEECSLLLPDLNLPVEDNSGSDILYGTS